MHHAQFTNGQPVRKLPAFIEPTFIHYQAGFLDGYRRGVADTMESNAARAEHAARAFYVMTADEDFLHSFTRRAVSAIEAHEYRAQSADWARAHCTYQGGPIDFWTGERIQEGTTAA